VGWLLYFGVTDTDESAERITHLGGTLLDEPTDSDFGRLVHATDPTGALFTIIQVTPR
jgi:predicted enzyme related to lactoylglutathione lyase